MGKSVYSLVLSDEVVRAIDAYAAREGFSRSAMINHVLAEYASLTTPEARLRELMAIVEQAMDKNDLRSSISSAGMLTLRTSLRYKYNPCLSYTLELYDGRDAFGKLRVDLRSQNETLLAYVQMFFQLWARLEEKYLPAPPGREQQETGKKRYARMLRLPPVVHSEEELGEAVAAYVTMIDGCIKVFFDHLQDAAEAVAETEKYYLQNFSSLGPAAEF